MVTMVERDFYENPFCSLLFYPLYLIYSFFGDTKSRLYFQQKQVFAGDIKLPYLDEYARRQYLIETYHHHHLKYIPPLSLSYKGKVDGAHRGLTAPRYYYKRFNKNMPIKISKDLPAPRLYTSIFLAENGKLKPIQTKNGISLFYNATLQTLVFYKKVDTISVADKKFAIRANGKYFWQKISKPWVFEVSSFTKKYPVFSEKYNNYFAVELPPETTSVSVSGFDVEIDVNDSQWSDMIFYQPDYGNIMR